METMIEPKPQAVVPAVPAVKLTKLEIFVLRNPHMSFDEMASQLNRLPGTMSNVCDRAHAKLRKAGVPLMGWAIARVLNAQG